MTSIIPRTGQVFVIILAALAWNTATGQTPIAFDYSGEVEIYVVPSCVAQIEITLEGASGGGGNGGNGSTVSGIIDVVEGQVLEIRVGGEGNCPGAGFNGGGAGGGTGGGGGGSGVCLAAGEVAAATEAREITSRVFGSPA